MGRHIKLKENMYNLEEKVYEKAKDIYGDPLSDEVKDRLDREFKYIRKYDQEKYFIFYSELIRLANLKPYEFYFRGTVGNSLIAYLCDMTEFDPMDDEYNLSEYFLSTGNLKFHMDISMNKYDEICYEEIVNELPGVASFKFDEYDPVHAFLIPEEGCESDEEEIKGTYKERYDFLTLMHNDSLTQISESVENGRAPAFKSGLIGRAMTIDDVFESALEYGIEPEKAAKIAEIIGGIGTNPEDKTKAIDILVEAGADEDFVDYCKKVEYLWTRAGRMNISTIQKRMEFYNLGY
ncbi:MAG: hypothetical protein II653_01225 [Lachnospiraceae bacterium]|nr:hypothetical protein [Lachnospiraceae bacterium]MBQ5473739.1 hypothetical protein [Lachnospiraceae bacterium]